MATLTKEQLKALSDNVFFDNDEWLITPDKHRGFNNQLIDAMATDEGVVNTIKESIKTLFLTPDECKVITDCIIDPVLSSGEVGYDEFLRRYNDRESYPQYFSLFEKLRNMDKYTLFMRVPFEKYEEEYADTGTDLKFAVDNSYSEMLASQRFDKDKMEVGYALTFKVCQDFGSMYWINGSVLFLTKNNEDGIPFSIEYITKLIDSHTGNEVLFDDLNILLT